MLVLSDSIYILSTHCKEILMYKVCTGLFSHEMASGNQKYQHFLFGLLWQHISQWARSFKNVVVWSWSFNFLVLHNFFMFSELCFFWILTNNRWDGYFILHGPFFYYCASSVKIQFVRKPKGQKVVFDGNNVSIPIWFVHHICTRFKKLAI